MKKFAALVLALTLVFALTACGGNSKEAELTVFAAASMQETLTEIGENYKKDHSNITLTFNFDSSGTLQTQIEEGADCDIFISAGQKQMNALEEGGSILAGSRFDLLENKAALAVPEGNPAGISSFDQLRSALEAETVLLVEKDKNDSDISRVSAMHIRAMDFEPFAFRINDRALPELVENYAPQERKAGRPQQEPFDAYRHITEQQHRIALEAAFALKSEYGYKELEDALINAYAAVGVKLNHHKAVSLITTLRSKRMIVQENGRKYTFMPDFHY